MPTGVHLSNPQELLFEAAERVLARHGASGLTSRAVTNEAGVAKGVMHRYFADFDAFVAELILDRAARLVDAAAGLREQSGLASILDNLAEGVPAMFGPLTVAEVALVVTRDGLSSRLRDAGAVRLPLLAEATSTIAGYLSAEQDHGRIATSADPATLAPTLVGALHLLYTEQDGQPSNSALRQVIDTVLAGAVRQPPSNSEPGPHQQGRPQRTPQWP